MKTLSALTEEVSKNNDQRQQKAKQIFLGIDAHLRSNQVARKKDNGGIQGVQSFGFAELLLFAQKQLQLAEEVYAVYEAGPLGYVLYRRLRELGIRAYVCAPECLEQGKRKHNKLDARKLASRLYSYVQGDREMLRVVRVPTPEQERSPPLPEWIRRQLEVWQGSLRLLDVQIAQHKKELAQSIKEALPKGFGAQTMVQLDREIGDYHRFANRRKVGCFGGFVPREHSTGKNQRLGSITKVGSPRIRTLIIEMVWRVVLFQPNYPPVVQWREVLGGSNKVLKKKAAVAVARRLLVDIWKMRTGRTTAQELGLILNPQPRP